MKTVADIQRFVLKQITLAQDLDTIMLAMAALDNIDRIIAELETAKAIVQPRPASSPQPQPFQEDSHFMPWEDQL